MKKIVKPKVTCEEEQKYLDYVDEHRENVMKAFEKNGKRYMLLLGVPEKDYDMIKAQIQSHDLSKYGKDEFEPYRNRFFPKKDEPYDRDGFEKAWIHHYMNNPHHWDFWQGIDGEEPREMKLNYLVELLADWEAMSMKFGGTPLTYYESKYESIKLHPKTRKILYDALKQLYPNKTL